jgi:two-component sensor histidine kinase
MTRALGAAFVSIFVLGLEMFHPSELVTRINQSARAALGYTACLALCLRTLAPWLAPDHQQPAPTAALGVFLRLLTMYVLSIVILIFVVRLSWYPDFGWPFGFAAKVFLLGLAMPCLLLGYDALRIILNAQLELRAAEAKALNVLMLSQLQPHTLLNALNGISALISSDPMAAQQSIERLGHILRRILVAADLERWSLAEEFECLKGFLHIQNLRMGSRLSFSLVLDEALNEQMIPPLLILPLVENAFQHGFRNKVGPCHLDVKAKGDTIDVTDNGTGCPATPLERIGLKTVRLRVQSLGGQLHISQNGKQGFHVSLTLGSPMMPVIVGGES